MFSPWAIASKPDWQINLGYKWKLYPHHSFIHESQLDFAQIVPNPFKPQAKFNRFLKKLSISKWFIRPQQRTRPRQTRTVGPPISLNDLKIQQWLVDHKTLLSWNLCSWFTESMPSRSQPFQPLHFSCPCLLDWWIDSVTQFLHSYVLDFIRELQRDQVSDFTFGLSELDPFVDQFHRFFRAVTGRQSNQMIISRWRKSQKACWGTHGSNAEAPQLFIINVKT